MYIDAKKMADQRKYTSISEFIRDAMRRMLYPQLTENGFTPEFEEQVLEAENDPNIFKWNGKGSFVDFAMKSAKVVKENDKRRANRKLYSKSSRNSFATAWTGRNNWI